ncbi:hypothetical protein L4F40_17765 [Vibrio paracholerae]|uniref:hypothetical protein n=1 Tax=Vibrio paracholerae TaxID=650003 RepID=UPI0020949CB6|nr:hypothetical protein [Vibrio paracholerae]MCO7017543.1 hypothetical protein [Vibrio paracholerae]
MKKVLLALVCSTLSSGVAAKTFGDYWTEEYGSIRIINTTADNNTLSIYMNTETGEIIPRIKGTPVNVVVDGAAVGSTLDIEEMKLIKNASSLMAYVDVYNKINFSTKGSGAAAIWLINNELKTEPKPIEEEVKYVYVPQASTGGISAYPQPAKVVEEESNDPKLVMTSELRSVIEHMVNIGALEKKPIDEYTYSDLYGKPEDRDPLHVCKDLQNDYMIGRNMFEMGARDDGWQIMNHSIKQYNRCAWFGPITTTYKLYKS